MEKRGQYRKNTLGMVWFAVNLIIGLYLILTLGLKLITFSFITDSINNIIIILGGALIILAGFISMRRSSSMRTIR